MRFRLLAVALIALLALGLTACSKPASGPGDSSTTSTPSATASGTDDPNAMAASNPDADALLTVADVQKASGLSGLKLVEASSTADAVGRLNFATGDGVLVATMNIGDGTAFNQALQTMMFAREATGTGSMSFVGPSPQVSKVLTVFAAAKGDHAVIMKTFTKVKDGTETWLTIEQLQSLTGLALSRWGTDS
jgi:hypothetical protein